MPTTLKVVQEIILNDATTALNVFHVQAAETLVEADIPNVEADIDAWLLDMYSNVTATVADTVTYGGYKLYEVVLATGLESFFTGGNASLLAGTNTADAFPNGVGPLLGFLMFGRPRHAQKYMAGFNEVSATDNNLTAGAIAATLLVALSMRAGPAAIGVPNFTWTSGIYSLVDKIFIPAGNTAYTNIGVSYQRRRKPGVGI